MNLSLCNAQEFNISSNYLYLHPFDNYMTMKRILRFLSLIKNDNCTLKYVPKVLFDYKINDILYVVNHRVIPVKSQYINTKIYIFECYSNWLTSFLCINTLKCIPNKVELKPILQKK